MSEKIDKMETRSLQGDDEDKEETILWDSNDVKPVEDQLKAFRHQWHSELRNRTSSPSSRGGSGSRPGSGGSAVGTQVGRVGQSQQAVSDEEVAKDLFLQAIWHEENGFALEAIDFYKKAMKIVPDIEYKVYQMGMQRQAPRVQYEKESSVEESENESGDTELGNLIDHFTRVCKVEQTPGYCEPEGSQTATHISALPNELLVYLLKWVVSSQLDMRALEQVSMTCRGFYLLCRDTELWRLACVRSWGVSVSRLPLDFSSWRDMYISRPHLLFNGCYISKVSYVRPGERSLDAFYRPYHLVEYYRLCRFFADGTFCMHTSPEPVAGLVASLRHPTTKVQGLLKGYYKISGDQITGILKRALVESNLNVRYKRNRRKDPNNNSDTKETFEVVFQLQAKHGKENRMLVWKKYALSTLHKLSGEEFLTDFDLGYAEYPPMTFARVTSYTEDASAPL